MPLTVRKFNAQVKDPQSGQMVPAGLLSSDSLQAIEAAESAAITEIQQKGAQTKADIPDDYTELSDSVGELKTQLDDFKNGVKLPSLRVKANNLVTGHTRTGAQNTGVTLKNAVDVGVAVNGTVDVSAANKTIYLTYGIALTSGKTYTIYVDTSMNLSMPTNGVVYLNAVYDKGVANKSIAQNTVYTVTPNRDTNMQITYNLSKNTDIGSVAFANTVFALYVVEGSDYTLKDFDRFKSIETDVDNISGRVAQNEADIETLEAEDANIIAGAPIYASASYRAKHNNLAQGKIRSATESGVTMSEFTDYGVNINGSVDISSAAKTIYLTYNTISLQANKIYTIYVDASQNASMPEGGRVYLMGVYNNGTANIGINTDALVKVTPSQDTSMQIVWYMTANSSIGTVHFNDTKLVIYVVEGYDYTKEDFVGKAEADAFNPYNYEEKTIYSTLVTGLPIFELTGNTTGMTKDNAVTLDWKFKGDSGTATVKWQGASSLNYPKKNYSVKLDHNIDVGWGAQKKYVLKGEFVDNSHSLNIGTAKIWGAIVADRNANPAIGNSPNNGAMIGFPVIVMLNGQFHGLYMFNTPKDPWVFGMGNSTTEYIVTAEAHTPATNFKALAELDGSDFEIEYKDDSVADATVKTSLNTLIQAVIDAGQNWEETVAPYLDINSAIDYYIFSALTDNEDGIDKNFILTTYDGTKWWFNAYDMDSVMGNYWHGGSYRTPYNSKTNLYGLASSSRLFSLIYSYSKAKLVARYNALRQTIMSDGSVYSTYYNHVVRIPEEVYRQDTIVWPMLPGTWTNKVARVSDFYHMRAEYIDRAIKAIEESLT